MSWTTYHRRGAVLRDVLDAVATRRDGLLPMDLPGVRAAFGDELTLLGALQLRWHTRLAGRVESDPGDPATARAETERELPGVREVLDHYRAEPADEAMARSTTVAAAKERAILHGGCGTLVA